MCSDVRKSGDLADRADFEPDTVSEVDFVLGPVSDV
jgi:hypothetical protein